MKDKELEELLESVAMEATLAQHDSQSDEFIGNVLKRRLLPLLKSGQEAMRLAAKARSQYILAGFVPLKDSMNPAEHLLYELNAAAAKQEAL